jgi:predicted amidohydrolase YtcJ
MNGKSAKLLFILFFIFILAFSGFNFANQQNDSSAAGLVLKNGFIYTVDGQRTVAEAVAVKDGKFVYVGSNGEVNPYIGKETHVIDLGGRMVLPGFFDSHCHPAYGAAHQLFDVMFTGLYTIEEYQKALREFAAKHADAKFIKGRGWKNTLFGKTGPDKKLIDEIVRDIPVALDDDSGHASWVNSKTLELAGITKETKNPRSGVIERDPETGEATGTLRESAAGLISDLFPDYTVEQLLQALEAYQKMAAAFGITTAHDASLDAGGNDFNAYKNLEKENRLAMRFRASLFVDPKKGLDQVKQLIAERAKNSGSLFQANGAKIYIDGVVEGSTAFLKEPYKHLPNFRGEPRWDTDKLNEMCAELDKNKFQIHVHAIGDAATAMTLDAFAYAKEKNGKRDSRNLITHIQLVDPRDILRFRELGVVAVPQPYWFMKDDYYYNIQVPYLGLKRADEEYPLESFFKAGVVVASSSDYAVTIPCNPLRAIQIGITRSILGVTDPKEILWPEERATLEQMIASFTINGAYANFLENTTGSIEVGKMADMIVLDKNLFKIPGDEISKVKVILTYFAGKKIFSDGIIENASL